MIIPSTNHDMTFGLRPGGGQIGSTIMPTVSPQPSSQSPATPTASPVDRYMSPYTGAVLDSAMANLNKVGTQRRNQLGTEAFQSGAYGDSRHGVEDANLTTDLAKTAGDLTAGVNSDAFDKAMGWLGQDTDRQLGASEFNANLDQQNIQNQLQEMGLGNDLWTNSLTQGQNYADALLGLDQYDRGYKQDVDNQKYQDFLDKSGWDSSQLSQFMNFINGTPGQTGTSTSTPNNQWASILGAALGNIKTSSGTKLFGG